MRKGACLRKPGALLIFCLLANLLGCSSGDGSKNQSGNSEVTINFREQRTDGLGPYCDFDSTVDYIGDAKFVVLGTQKPIKVTGESVVGYAKSIKTAEGYHGFYKASEGYERLDLFYSNPGQTYEIGLSESASRLKAKLHVGNDFSCGYLQRYGNLFDVVEGTASLDWRGRFLNSADKLDAVVLLGVDDTGNSGECNISHHALLLNLVTGDRVVKPEELSDRFIEGVLPDGATLAYVFVEFGGKTVYSAESGKTPKIPGALYTYHFYIDTSYYTVKKTLEELEASGGLVFDRSQYEWKPLLLTELASDYGYYVDAKSPSLEISEDIWDVSQNRLLYLPANTESLQIYKVAYNNLFADYESIPYATLGDRLSLADVAGIAKVNSISFDVDKKQNTFAMNVDTSADICSFHISMAYGETFSRTLRLRAPSSKGPFVFEYALPPDENFPSGARELSDLYVIGFCGASESGYDENLKEILKDFYIFNLPIGGYDITNTGAVHAQWPPESPPVHP